MGYNYNAIILNSQNNPFLLDSIRLLNKEQVEVILIDESDSSELLDNLEFQIKYIKINQKVSFDVYRNLGIEFVSYDYTFFLRGDIPYVAGTIKSYCNILNTYKDAISVSHCDNSGSKDPELDSVNGIKEGYTSTLFNYSLFRSNLLKKYQYSYGSNKDFYIDVKEHNYRFLHLKNYTYESKNNIDLFLLNNKPLNKDDINKRPNSRIVLPEPQTSLSPITPVVANGKTDVDVVILSYTYDNNYYNMTKDAIFSLVQSEPNIKFNIYLIETNKNFKEEYPEGYNANLIIPEFPFHYNKFLNIGLSYCNNENILICNNDVLFKNAGWLTNVLNQMRNNNALSASPCNYKNKRRGVKEGYKINKHILGCCLIIKKSILKTVNFDERFAFWYQDNDYAEQIKRNKIKHIRVNNSVIDHLGSKSHPLLKENLQNYTYGMGDIFNKKWENQ